jgi:hypothetical protein
MKVTKGTGDIPKDYSSPFFLENRQQVLTFMWHYATTWQEAR